MYLVALRNTYNMLPWLLFPLLFMTKTLFYFIYRRRHNREWEVWLFTQTEVRKRIADLHKDSAESKMILLNASLRSRQ